MSLAVRKQFLRLNVIYLLRTNVQRICRGQRRRKETHFQNAFNFVEVYWLATSGGRVPAVAVCVLYGQLRICCVTESATL